MKCISLEPICKSQTHFRTIDAFQKNYVFYFRARKVWWSTFSVICIVNFVLIGAKKLWTYRKLQAAQNQGGNIVIENLQQQPQHNALQLNNAIHNKDVMSITQDVLVCLVAVGMFLGTYITSLFIEKNRKDHLAVRFFFHFNAHFLARALIVPVVFFAMNKHARRHVKTTFWNEWAPDFIQNYNPNGFIEIELTNHPSVSIPPTSTKGIAGTLNTLNAVLPGQTLTDESTPTTESTAPGPNHNTAFDIVTSPYVPLPSTSKCLVGPGTSFLIPIGPDLPS